MDVEIKNLKEKKRSVGDFKVKWWNLIGENVTKLSDKNKGEGNRELARDANTMWEEIDRMHSKVGKGILRVSTEVVAE